MTTQNESMRETVDEILDVLIRLTKSIDNQFAAIKEKQEPVKEQDDVNVKDQLISIWYRIGEIHKNQRDIDSRVSALEHDAIDTGIANRKNFTRLENELYRIGDALDEMSKDKVCWIYSCKGCGYIIGTHSSREKEPCPWCGESMEREKLGYID